MSDAVRHGQILETNMVLRAGAILAVVALHARMIDFGGGAFFLLALAGFNFRRFKLPSFVRDASPWPSTIRYQRKILTPYLITVLAYFAWKGTLEIDVVLAVSNLIRRDGMAIFPIWFIQVLFQCTMLTAAIFCVPWMRRMASERSFAFGLVFLGVAIGVAALARPYIVDGSLNHRTPLWMMSFVALGWACASAQTSVQRGVAAVVAIGFAAFMLDGSVRVWVGGGLFAMLAVPSFRAPRAMATAVNTIANASYYIFLLHMTAFHGLKVVGLDAPAMLFGVGTAFGLLGWYTLDGKSLHREAGTRLVRGLRAAQPRAAAAWTTR